MYLVVGQDYEGGVENVSLSSAQQDIINFATTSSVPIVVQYVEVTSGTTNQNIMRTQALKRTGASSATTGSPTISPINKQSGAAATTVISAATTQGSAGDVFGSQNWNVAAPLEYDWTPGGVLVPVSGWFAIQCVAAFGSALVVSVRFKITELR